MLEKISHDFVSNTDLVSKIACIVVIFIFTSIINVENGK